MKIENLGKFRVGGSINTQFETGLALERIMIASGERVNGLTSFLTTLEFFGHIILILTAVLILTAYAIIYFMLFLINIYKFITGYNKRREVNASQLTEEEINKRLAKFEMTEEEEKEVENFH